MPVLDFPTSPISGQKYPTTPAAGQPQYTWDGQKWTTGIVVGDDRHVLKSGDIMTGDLNLMNPGDFAGLYIEKAPGVKNAVIQTSVCTQADFSDYKARWSLYLGDSSPETGSNAGSNFTLRRHDDAGADIFPNVLYAYRETGRAYVGLDPVEPLGIATKQYVDNKRVRYPLNGVKTIDIQVPAGAQAMRIQGCVIPTSATGIALQMLMSIAAGVFKTGASDYSTNGFVHSTTTTPTAVVATIVTQAFMTISGTHTSLAQTIHFEGVYNLKRPTTTQNITGDIRSVIVGAGGVAHSFYMNTITAAALGSALEILAFRLFAPAGDVWAVGSYVNVEWL